MTVQLFLNCKMLKVNAKFTENIQDEAPDAYFQNKQCLPQFGMYQTGEPRENHKTIQRHIKVNNNIVTKNVNKSPGRRHI